MEHLKMHSINKVDENVSKIATLFPNCVTEAKNENGELTHKIDFDMLKQELGIDRIESFVITRFPVITPNQRVVSFNIMPVYLEKGLFEVR